MIQPKRRPGSGFTIVEVIVVLAVASIIIGIATPSFMSIIANNRVATASNELVTALNLAKSEAIRTGQNTVMCKSSSGDQCDSSASWGDGWLLFTDTDNSDTVNNDERIIRVQSAVERSLNFAYSGSNNAIAFNSNGRTNANGRFCFNNAYKQENSRAVIITLAGRVRTEVRNSANNCAPSS